MTALEGPLTSTVTIEIMDEKQARECPTSAAFDRSVWRVVGAPLAPALASGPLDGCGVAVKDLFAVAGHPVGGGVPAYLAGQRPRPASAACVTALQREARTW